MKIYIILYGRILENKEIKGVITDMNVLPDACYSIQTVEISEACKSKVDQLTVLDSIEDLGNENILYIREGVTKLIEPLKTGTMLL